ncbi:S9 family peptidase [Sphingomonas sp. 67-41]|uniref:alpha/beta hydrolase family protein n=1 Tax=Sphingomonas TaxID=13687 RepID=UPI002579CFA7|nr:hypothetical protein [Sphingomonas sp. 67-41]
MRREITCLLAAISGWSQPATGQVATGSQDARNKLQLEFHQGKGSGICPYNRVTIDPAFRHVTLWRQEIKLSGAYNPNSPGFFATLDLARYDEERARSSYSADWQLEPIRYSETGNLIARVGPVLLEIVPGKPDPVSVEYLPLPWVSVRLTAVKFGGAAPFKDRATLDRLEAIEAGKPLRVTATVADRVDFAFTAAGPTMIHHPEGTSAGGLMMSVEAPVTDPARPQALIVRGDQLAAQFPGAPFLGHARPLFDLATGRIVGRYGIGTVERWNPNAARLEAVPFAANARMFILDAVANGDKIAILAKTSSKIDVVRLDGKGRQRFAICDNDDYLRHLGFTPPQAQVQMERRQVLLGDPHSGDPTFGYLYTPAKANGRLFVYFHGGPQGSLEDQLPMPVERLAPQGYSVLAVEYPSSIGAGFAHSDALARRGISVLEQSVSRIAAWTRKHGYRDTFVIGYSFGAVPAAIAVADHPKTFGKAFFLAPLITWREANTTTVDLGLPQKVSVESQHRADLAIFGGRENLDRFNQALSEKWNRIAPGTSRFYFGSLDPISTPGDLPAKLRAGASILVQEKVQHGFVGSFGLKGDEVWADIIKAVKPGLSQQLHGQRPAGPSLARSQRPIKPLRRSHDDITFHRPATPIFLFR